MKASAAVVWRSALFWLLLTLLTLVYAPLFILISFFLPLRWRYGVVRYWPRIALWMLHHCCGLSYEVSGRECLPNEPCVVFSKHQSTWETLYLCANLPMPVFVAKRELLWLPLFGWGMAMLRYITINRGSGRKAVLHIVEQARDRVRRGMWIIIFPEGTRRKPGAPPRYKLGGAVMATQLQLPALPVAVNAGTYWPKGLLIYPGCVRLSFLPVIEPQKKTAEQLIAEVQAVIEQEQQRLEA